MHSASLSQCKSHFSALSPSSIAFYSFAFREVSLGLLALATLPPRRVLNLLTARAEFLA
jgi:hypothetical protein